MTSLLLLAVGLLSAVLASNPDSEVAQDPDSESLPSAGNSSSNASGTSERLQQIQSRTSGGIPVTLLQGPVIGPIRTGTFVTKEVLRQVLPNGFVNIERRERLSVNGHQDSINGRNFPQFGYGRVVNSYGFRYRGRQSSATSYPSVNLNARTPQRAFSTPRTVNNEQYPQRTSGNRRPDGFSNAGGRGRPEVTLPRRPPPRQFFLPSPQDGRNHTNMGGYSRVRSKTVHPPSTPSPNHKRVTNPDLNLYAGIVNEFAFRLVDALDLQSNFVVSPLSIFVALSMCYLGSDGTTKIQLERFLGMDLNSVHNERLHQGVRDLMRAVSPRSADEYQLLVANGMFLGKKYTVNPDFESSLQRFYAAELKNLDFANPGLSLPVINSWVSQATRNMITKIGDDPPDPKTILLLMNAIYFKGVWKKQFPTNMTYLGRFFTPDGKDKLVPTMPLYGETFPLYRSDSHRHTFMRLPYQGDQVSMIVALPFTFRDHPMPANTDNTLCHIRDALVDTVLDSVALPKFRTEFTVSLKQPLARAGITDLFNPRSVNLSRLRLANDVVVADVVHKAVVEVTEQGTTASASTGVRFVPLAYKNTTDFVVNHPFAYYIVHEASGLVLFYGKVFDLGVDPASESQ